MAPVQVASIIVDEDSPYDTGSRCRRKSGNGDWSGGQNVQLGLSVNRMEINVLTEEEAGKQQEAELGRYVDLFRDQLEVDEDLAQVLAEEGYRWRSCLRADGEMPRLMVSMNLVTALRTRAKMCWLIRRWPKKLETAEPADDLLNMDGMTKHLALSLPVGASLRWKTWQNSQSMKYQKLKVCLKMQLHN